MADKAKVGSVEVRQVETEYGETGVGVPNRVEVEYQLGADVNGAWVPFASVSESRAEMFQARAEAEAEKEAADKKAAAKPGA